MNDRMDVDFIPNGGTPNDRNIGKFIPNGWIPDARTDDNSIPDGRILSSSSLEKFLEDLIMEGWMKAWNTPTTVNIMESNDQTWSVSICNNIQTGKKMQEGRFKAKRHVVSWQVQVDIEQEQNAIEHEEHEEIQMLKGWIHDERQRTIKISKSRFKDGEEDYEHLLMDMLLLNLGVNCSPSSSHSFTMGEEEDAHEALDIIMSDLSSTPPKKTTMRQQDPPDLMEWDEGEEEEVTDRKRKNIKHHMRKGQVRVMLSNEQYYCEHAQYHPKMVESSLQQRLPGCCNQTRVEHVVHNIVQKAVRYNHHETRKEYEVQNAVCQVQSTSVSPLKDTNLQLEKSPEHENICSQTFHSKWSRRK